MSNIDNGIIQKSINYTWGAMFFALGLSSINSFQSVNQDGFFGGHESSKQENKAFLSAKPEALSTYFGVNETIKVLVTPEKTDKLLGSKAFSRFKADYKSVSGDYLFQTESGEMHGFNPASGLIYDDDAINVYTGKSSLNQLLRLEKTISDINALPNSLADDSQTNSSTESKEENVHPLKQNYIAEKEQNKDSEDGKKLEGKKSTGSGSISEKDIQKLIESKFKIKTGAKNKDESRVITKGTQAPSIESQKITDIESLRAQLKQRVQKDFGHIPNAGAEIEKHLGRSGSASPRPAQNINSDDVSNNQVNVRAIRETANAVYYKDERLPKIGFDPEGNRVSEEQKKNQVKGLMGRIIELDDQWSVVYRAKGEEKKRIAVFSDPTCPYCKKLHELMPEIQEAGVTVYHMFYNRSMAPNTVSDPRVVNVNEGLSNAWCSTDPKEALNSLYAGYPIPEAECNNPEEKIEFPGNEHYLIGRIIDMSGTPYTITEDGEVIAGFTSRGARQPENYLDSIGL